MKYALCYDNENEIIVYKTKEQLSLEETIDITYEIAEFAKSHNCYLLLTDIRNNDAALEITELLDLTKYYKNIPITDNFKNAILFSESSTIRKNIEFYESLCHTAGYRTKSFTSHEHAIKWLKNNQCPNTCKTFNLY